MSSGTSIELVSRALRPRASARAVPTMRTVRFGVTTLKLNASSSRPGPARAPKIVAPEPGSLIGVSERSPGAHVEFAFCVARAAAPECLEDETTDVGADELDRLHIR